MASQRGDVPRDLQVGDTIEFHGVEFICPFSCGGTVYADADEGNVMHMVPICKVFRESEPDDYIAAARRMIERMEVRRG